MMLRRQGIYYQLGGRDDDEEGEGEEEEEEEEEEVEGKEGIEGMRVGEV